MEKRHYLAEWTLISFLFLTAYTFPSFYYKSLYKNEKYITLLVVLYLLAILCIVIKHIRGIEGKKINHVMLWCLICGIVASLTAQYWNTYLSDINILNGNIFPVLFLFIFYKCSFIQAYLWEIFYLTCVGVTKVVYIIFCGVIQDNYFEVFFSYNRVHSINEIIYAIVINLVVLLILNSSVSKIVIERVLISYKIYLGMLTFCIWKILRILLNYGKGKINIDNLIFVLIFLLVFILTLLVLFGNAYGSFVKMEKRALDERNNTMLVQYNELNKSYEEYRCLIHDEKYLISYVIECLSEENIQGAICFLTNSQKLIKEKERRVWTGIPCLDCILSMKEQQLKKLGINFIYDLNVTDVFLEEVDFVILMSNLLDNAIEASEQCQEGKRMIDLYMKNYNEMLVISVKNSCIKQPVKKEAKFITSKFDSDKHGFGIESINKIVNKYQGEISFLYDNDFFMVRVRMNDVRNDNE